MSPPAPTTISVNEIVHICSRYFGLPIEDLTSRDRRTQIALMRQIGIYIATQATSKSHGLIAAQFGLDNHSTCVHARDKIERLLKEGNPAVVEAVNNIMAVVQERCPGFVRPPRPKRYIVKRSWTKEELSQFRKLYVVQKLSPEEVAKALGRTKDSVIMKARVLGVFRKKKGVVPKAYRRTAKKKGAVNEV